LIEDLETRLVDVDVDEVTARTDVRGDIGSAEINATTTEVHARRGTPLLATAAVLLMALLVGGLWLMRRDDQGRSASQPPASSKANPPDETVATAPLARVPPPPGMIPSTATMERQIETSLGHLLVYNDPTGHQTCLYLDTGTSFSGSCFGDDAIATYDAVTEIYPDRDGRGMAFGLVPTNVDTSIEVGGSIIRPDDKGLWFAALDPSVVSYDLVTPTRRITILTHPTVSATATT
jgi:hypothetical protein